ncbi:MAG: hypothetical protein MUF10_18425 [Thermoanaerobaculaceae bacterium]|jgi:hypothetical protein|nr:hypothetical protein [Thermoanaerobaculaceae bacterium]
MARASERGEGKVGCVIGLIILAIALWVGIKFIPVRVAVASLQDFVEETAQKAGLLREGSQEGDTREKQIIYLITRKADEERLPVKADNIEVRVNNQRCIIVVKYRVTIDFGFYKYDWNVEHNVDRILF